LFESWILRFGISSASHKPFTICSPRDDNSIAGFVHIGGMKTKLFSLLALMVSLRLFAETPTPTPDANALKWDAESKECTPKPGESSVAFAFVATNVANCEVLINSLHTSCGCTVAQLPATPYKLAPGSNVTINVSMNLAGKTGRITKSVSVDSTAGVKPLLVTANIPTELK